MLNDIPMFDKDAVLNAQNVRGIVALLKRRSNSVSFDSAEGPV
jgi:hypothetical protein